MKRIILLTDYKGFFGSRWDAVPYNSGFNKKLLSKYFAEAGYESQYVNMADVKKLKNIKGVPVLYTSSEDVGYHYKDFIEDVVYYLELMGANVIPGYKFLRANNNKVFMELLRSKYPIMLSDKLKSWSFGTFEELESIIDEIEYPIVIKTAQGATSKGVSLAKNKKKLIKKVKQISRTKHIFQDIKDNLRPYKHKGYLVNSLYRNKFILQSFIPNLKNDWKILAFGNKLFVLTRHVAKNDFRASGSHNNYLAGSKAILPEGLLDYAFEVFQSLKIPHLSLDVVYDGEEFNSIEYQALYFGTSTINMSDVYFEKKGSDWQQAVNDKTVEYYYVKGVMNYLERST